MCAECGLLFLNRRRVRVCGGCVGGLGNSAHDSFLCALAHLALLAQVLLQRPSEPLVHRAPLLNLSVRRARLLDQPIALLERQLLRVALLLQGGELQKRPLRTIGRR